MGHSIVKLNKILCPVDFSECSYYALKYAVDLCSKFKADIHIVHVLPGFPLCSVPYSFDEKVPTDITCHWDILEEDIQPFLGIVDYANEKEIDLIVISTHGCGGLRHSLFGSTTERVIRKSPCPVMTVRMPETN